MHQCVSSFRSCLPRSTLCSPSLQDAGSLARFAVACRRAWEDATAVLVLDAQLIQRPALAAHQRLPTAGRRQVSAGPARSLVLQGAPASILRPLPLPSLPLCRHACPSPGRHGPVEPRPAAAPCTGARPPARAAPSPRRRPPPSAAWPLAGSCGSWRPRAPPPPRCRPAAPAGGADPEDPPTATAAARPRLNTLRALSLQGQGGGDAVVAAPSSFW